VVTAPGNNWRYGATHEKQEKLQPLLEALQELRDGGLTAAGVVAAIHRRRVLPLAERRLPLSEMMPGVDLEGSQMSSVPLSADDLRRRVAGTVGRLDSSALTQPLMRPERGCVSLVSVRSFSYLVSGCL
jgi:Ser/Thr protein kinase RdoA (MazF antagonist)